MKNNLIFNKDGHGADEIHRLIGMIDSDLNFEKWEPWLKAAVRQITSIAGKEVFDAAATFYYGGEIDGIEGKNDILTAFLEKVQTSNILFAWLKIIPTLDAQHGNSGRQKRLGENERGLTAVEQFKDESNIQNLAYDSLDDLLDFLMNNAGNLPFWTQSDVYREMNMLIIPNLATFDRFYAISSFRLFVAIMPWIKEVQDNDLIPVLTRDRLNVFLEALKKKEDELTDYEIKLLALKDKIYRPVVLLSMIKAFKRLPVQAIPEGLVQVQIVGTVKERIRATESAIKTQIANLSDDAQYAMSALQNELATLNGNKDAHVPTARVVGNGFTF